MSIHIAFSRCLEHRNKEYSLSKNTIRNKPVFLNRSFSAAPTSTVKLRFCINVDLFMPLSFKKFSQISISNIFANNVLRHALRKSDF